jgi:DNA polymerase-3 subunit alpha
MSEIPVFKEKFINSGLSNGCSPGIMDYLWDVQVHRQLGYSFSQIHTTAYSLIALQEMNLNYFYPSIYWATACLTVNSGGADEDSNGTTNYGKLSSAIGRIKAQGIIVELPDINKAKLSFTPDADSGSIIYGLKGISELGNDAINEIIENRPYQSFDDFLAKTNLGKTQIISLIKAGCFDKLEKEKTRSELMYYYMGIIVPKKNKLTLANVGGLIRNNVLPKNKGPYIKLYNFNKYLKLSKKNNDYILDERAVSYFSKNFDIDLLTPHKKQYKIDCAVWDKIYKNKMEELKTYINDHQEKLIDKLQAGEIQDIWKNYCEGSLSTWEMDTLGFYHHEHELTNVNHMEFKFDNFFDMSEVPIPKEYREYKGKQLPVMELQTICGTVLDKSSYKHTVVLLTPQGVVNVKCVAEQYSEYDKQISKVNPETHKKEVIEKSWFKRGTKLIVCGWRNGSQFMARGRQSEHKYPFYKILDIDDLGQLEITRFRCEE